MSAMTRDDGDRGDQLKSATPTRNTVLVLLPRSAFGSSEV
jgi:hypothetical protein